MSIQRGRQRAEAEMTLTVIPHEPNGYDTTGPGGSNVAKFIDHTPHIAKVQAGSQTQGVDSPTRFETIGSVSRPVLTDGLHIPVSAPCPVAGLPGRGWEYSVDALGPDDDAALLTRRYRVVNAPAKSKATARRLDVVEVEVP